MNEEFDSIRQIKITLPSNLLQLGDTTSPGSTGDDKKYIVVLGGDEPLIVTDTCPDRGYVIAIGERSWSDDPVAKMLLDGVLPLLAQLWWQEGKREQVGYVDATQFPDNRVQFCLTQPDEWLVAIAVLIAEGVLQNTAYDLIKLRVQSGISKLRGLGLAPEQPRSGEQPLARFTWEIFATDDTALSFLYFSILLVLQKRSASERQAVLERMQNLLDDRQVELACSPKADPCVMRVSWPDSGKEILDDDQATEAAQP